MLKHRSLDFSEFSEFNAQADKRNKVLPTRQTLGPGVVVAIVSKINCSPKTAKLYVVIFCGIKLFLQLFAVFIVVCSSQKKRENSKSENSVSKTANVAAVKA